tara:strand:+ start:1903 stop:2154 length:252 start_codon:yes stop_codon:yes gene_type:complete
MAQEEVPEGYIENVVVDGFATYDQNGNPVLTDLGLNEKNRLCTLAGLNIKYLSERKKEQDEQHIGEGHGDDSEVPQDTVSAGI